MRQVTAGLFHSLDGVVESPDQFQFDSFDDELGAMLGQFTSVTDTVVLGRTSYQEWASYWPSAGDDDPFAAFINSVPKHVASRTLQGPLEWQNSTVMDKPLVDYVTDLKQGTGADIAVCGSISVVRQLLFAGLLDELTVMTHPVIAGPGRRLFGPEDPTTRLRLASADVTSKGNVVSRYTLA